MIALVTPPALGLALGTFLREMGRLRSPWGMTRKTLGLSAGGEIP